MQHVPFRDGAGKSGAPLTNARPRAGYAAALPQSSRQAVRESAVMQITATFATILRQVPPLVRELVVAPALRIAALLILPYAGVLVGLDVAARYGAVTGAALPAQFFLSQDLSFGEFLEYGLMLAMAAMLFLMWRRDRSPIYLVNALLFAVLTADNALELHEKFGFWVAPWMPQNLPIEPHHLGEPVLFAGIGAVWLAGLGLSLDASRARSLVNSLLLIGCIGATAFFGIFVDEVVVFGEHTEASTQVQAFIEDGGEFAMIVLAFLLTVAMFDTERRRARAPAAGEPVTELPLAA
jgi:hypothetical protein